MTRAQKTQLAELLALAMRVVQPGRPLRLEGGHLHMTRRAVKRVMRPDGVWFDAPPSERLVYVRQRPASGKATPDSTGTMETRDTAHSEAAK